jgi:hypothetical protein
MKNLLIILVVFLFSSLACRAVICLPPAYLSTNGLLTNATAVAAYRAGQRDLGVAVRNAYNRGFQNGLAKQDVSAPSNLEDQAVEIKCLAGGLILTLLMLAAMAGYLVCLEKFIPRPPAYEPAKPASEPSKK